MKQGMVGDEMNMKGILRQSIVHSWKNILKEELEITDLGNQVADMLESDDSIMSISPDGDYDDELEGYRDTGETYVTEYISLEPTTESEEDDEVTIEFDLNFYDYQLHLRLGSYTGSEGYYIAVEDWGEEDREALLALKQHLEEKR